MLQIWASMGKHGYGQSRFLGPRQTRQLRILGSVFPFTALQNSVVAGVPALRAGLGGQFKITEFKVSLGHGRPLKRKNEKENKQNL